MPFPKVRSTLNLDAKAWANQHGYQCKDPSLARQDQAKEADINYILEQFGVTGVLPIGLRIPTYGDFDGISDYRDAIHAVREAEKSFALVPAKLRDQLNNDPQKFLEFCADPRNLDTLREHGLAPPAPQAASTPAKE